MEMTSTRVVPASQEQAWKALNDPDILKACIPGCENIVKLSDSEYELTMTARIGPVSAKFKGKMTLADPHPPDSYRLVFEGTGGAAGFAKGAATVTLAPDGTGTQIGYTVNAQVGGKLAQIGSRLIDGAAQKMADDFFACFANNLGRAPTAETDPVRPVALDQSGVTSGRGKAALWGAAAVAAAVAAALILYFLAR